jgi:hypothetical protein
LLCGKDPSLFLGGFIRVLGCTALRLQEQSDALEFLLAEAAREQQQLQQAQQQEQGQEQAEDALQRGEHAGRRKPQLVLVGATPPREALVERWVQQVRAGAL